MQTKLDESANTTNQSDMASKMSTSVHQQRTKAWRVATSIGVSFKYAAAGVTYAFHTQRNFRIHCVMDLIRSQQLGGLLMIAVILVLRFKYFW